MPNRHYTTCYPTAENNPSWFGPGKRDSYWADGPPETLVGESPLAPTAAEPPRRLLGRMGILRFGRARWGFRTGQQSRLVWRKEARFPHGRWPEGLRDGADSGTIGVGVTGHLVGPLVFKTKERPHPRSLVGSIPIHSR